MYKDSRTETFLKLFKKLKPEERNLFYNAEKYQHYYFQDVTLKWKSTKNKLASVAYKNGVMEEFNLQDLGSLTISNWIFRIRGLPTDIMGTCNPKRRTITINAGLTKEEQRFTLLHEMIHAYENMLLSGYRDWLMIDLYERIKRKLGKRKLDKLLRLSTHNVFYLNAHTAFFLLKSIDLDYRCNLNLGSIFGYGREDLFSTKIV